jgi:tRNA A-37 threonylcarbamoyl transferase component Bud32
MNKEFSSLVNRVVLRKSGVIPFVEKVYTDIAICTGIPVPIARWKVEKRILFALDNLKNWELPNIKAPKIIEFNENIPSINLEFIQGQKITPDLYIAPQLFHQLGQWLGKIEKLFYKQRNEIFEGLWDTQKHCGLIISKLKGVVSSDEPQESDYGFSLGDVGLKNIIYSNTKLYLLDFEFGHISLLGRDVGQLAAQLSVFNYNLDYKNNLLKGYYEVGGDELKVAAWTEIFKSYYLTKGAI